VFILLSLFLTGCGDSIPEYCEARADDPDCDGVPDAWDQCPNTLIGDATNRLGCSEGQAARCSVRPVEPEDRARLKAPARFRWTGDCDVWMLQLSDDPDFPAGATRTAIRTSASEVLITGEEKYWRVVGGREGSSAAASTPPREVKKWR